MKINTKSKKIIINIVTILFIILFILSLYHLIKYKLDEKNIDNQIELIKEKVDINEIDDSGNTELIEQLEEPPKTNPYWDYIGMSLIDVNFNELKSINSNVKGWIQINGTNINYPFVQTSDNDYYLTHSFNKSRNEAGWVFLDYRNNISNFNDKNTIIYAHGRLDNTMFGSLKNILSNGWLNNKNNYVVKLSTEYENTLWQVFSVYRIPTTSDYIQTSFNKDSEFEVFTNMLIERSNYNFDTTVSSSDRILTLSTCYNLNDKVVLHAKLIKREAK